MYLHPHDLKEVSLEITTKCNAACPMCSRYRTRWLDEEFDTRAPNPQMPLTDLAFELFARRFDANVLKRVQRMIFNGKLGDPLVHPQCLEFFRHVRRVSEKTEIFIYTNGSLGTPSFWKLLASVLGERGVVIFSIDGLEDTNVIYRQKTSWSRIMSSCKVFMEAGGVAIWDFLVFRHNESQVEEARQLSLKMGFRSFEVRRTNRFKGGEHFDYVAVDGSRRRLSVPRNSNYVYEYHDKYLLHAPAKAEIDCHFRKESKIFVSYAGKVWPCSFISEYFPETAAVRSIVARYGSEFNDLNRFNLDEIMNSRYFAHDLETSWATGVGLAKECWRKCTRLHRNITSIEEMEGPATRES